MLNSVVSVNYLLAGISIVLFKYNVKNKMGDDVMDKIVYEIRRFEAGVFDGLIFEFELKEPVSPDEVSKIKNSCQISKEELL